MIKVTIDAGNGEVEEIECDGVVCGCVTRGEGPTGIWVDTLHGGLEYIEECRALNAMGAAIYGRMAGKIKEATDER